MSNSCEFGSSRSLLKASIADTNLHFLKYSSASGIATSQMKVHPATKNGYRLKKPSMETRTDSMLIFPASSAATSAMQGNGVKRLKRVNEKKGFANALGEGLWGEESEIEEYD
ncbi:hypothetical protein V8G54_018256 [Vigna mungo]|uniref:Uncharacterized protein n=1 Tax=Vigna mungo TaxID=3915 RepID=A0AAQ3N8J0_VIGMU